MSTLATYSLVRVFAVRVETASMGSDSFIVETFNLTAMDAADAQQFAIDRIEARGDCFRHVLSVTPWKN